MGRFVLLWLVLSVSAAAQDAPQPVEPGTRVRILYASEDLPVEGSVFTGTLRSVGDTLVMVADSGPVLQFSPRDLAGFDVSAGRRAFPYWLVGLGAAVGAGGGYLLGDALFEEEFVPINGLAGSRKRPPGFHMTIVAGTTLGLVASAFVGTRWSAERWVPAGELGMAGTRVNWRLGLWSGS
jgi:hypothetical protein